MQLTIELEETLADKVKTLMHTDNLKKAVEETLAKIVNGMELQTAKEIQASLDEAREGKTRGLDALLDEL